MATDNQQQDEQWLVPEKELLDKLRKGQEWLTKQHEYWLSDHEDAVDNATFGEQQAAWDEHERILRKGGYKGCIWQPLNRCPTASPVKCVGCMPEQPGLW